MKKIIDKGIIGYFDIMGYQNFLTNNKIEDCINIIEEILIKIPDEIKNDYFNFNLKNDLERFINDYFHSHLNISFISDTIIFFFDFETIKKEELSVLLNQILFYLVIFTRLSFEKGFSMRGYIDYDSFYYNNDKNKNIIAGESIVNCHKETSKLNFSGLIIGDKLINFCTELSDGYINQLFDRKLIKKYKVNTKNGEEYRHVANFILGADHGDIVQYVFESFHKHNKEINDEVMAKIKNTEKLIRHFVFNNKSQF